MDMRLTSVYEQNAAAWLGGKRRALNEGGTSSSKTYSILQLLILIAQGAKVQMLISVVSESLPHLKRGAIRDFFNILGESPDNNPRWSKTEFTYTVPANGCKVEFFGADDEDKVRGPRRDILFVNEGNNVSWETVRGLDIRTTRFTFVDWNPVAQFWAHEQWLGSPENAYIHSTYLDSRSVLPPEVVANIESNRDKDPNWWRVYGLGELGHPENIIWPHYEIVQDLPARCDWGPWAYGVDFGYVNPSSAVKVVSVGGKFYWDECLYAPNLTNSDIIERLTHEERADLYCDAAEPARIEELCRAGWIAWPANKDVTLGLDLVRRQTLYVTKRSVAGLKEIRNYCRRKDRDGHVLEEPLKINDHFCDAGRYGSMGITERFGFATAVSGLRVRTKHSRFAF